MKIVIAIDSFKGSLSSFEAGEAIKRSALKAFPDAQVSVVKVADGGEGTMEALCEAYGAKPLDFETVDPQFKKINARCYANDKTFLMDVSSCIGLPLLKEEERDPMYTTSFGVGSCIYRAITMGYRSFVIGLGGSSTNDAGIGMLQALGYYFLSSAGMCLFNAPWGAYGAGTTMLVVDEHVTPELKECEFTVLCDVKNPLLGENGCTYVYSPQKGAKPEQLPEMEQYLTTFARVVKEYNPNADENEPGCGAAGGLGYAFRSFFNSRLVSGIEAVIKATALEEKIAEADIVITGEGSLDGQSLNGKAPMEIAKLALEKGKRAVAFCGKLGNGYEACLPYLHSAHEICDPELSLEQNMSSSVAIRNLERVSYDFFSHLDKSNI